MGVVVDLTDLGVDPRLDRLFVVGLRLASDADEGAAELETLIGHHQASRKGFTFVRQGQPTNNTERVARRLQLVGGRRRGVRHFHPAAPRRPRRLAGTRDGAGSPACSGSSPACSSNRPATSAPSRPRHGR